MHIDIKQIIDTGCLRELMEDIAVDCEECRGNPGITVCCLLCSLISYYAIV